MLYEVITCHVLELFGSNSEIWIKRHILLHHPYPNVQNWDCDIKQSNLVRLFPNSKWYKFHKFQHIYMWFLYPFYTRITSYNVCYTKLLRAGLTCSRGNIHVPLSTNPKDIAA